MPRPISPSRKARAMREGPVRWPRPISPALDEAVMEKPSENQRSQSPAKQEFIEKSKAFWNPNKTQFWQDQNVDLVIDRREGYLLYDMDGRRLIDVHLNGGTYNIGHRHPELIEGLHRGTTRFDMGNHHFPALGRTALAEELAKVCGGGMQYTMYTAGGAEAID